MAKQKSHATNTSKKKQKRYVITSGQQRQFEKSAERDIRIEQGYDPAYQGGGAHGGTVEAQKRRERKKSRKDLNNYRNQGTRTLED